MNERLGFYFWIHLILVFLIWTSPFYLNWKIILIFVGIFYLQLGIYGDCILNKKQFRTKFQRTTIFIQILEKLGFEINRKRMIFISDYFLPWIVFGFAVFWQVILGK